MAAGVAKLDRPAFKYNLTISGSILGYFRTGFRRRRERICDVPAFAKVVGEDEALIARELRSVDIYLNDQRLGSVGRQVWSSPFPQVVGKDIRLVQENIELWPNISNDSTTLQA